MKIAGSSPYLQPAARRTPRRAAREDHGIVAINQLLYDHQLARLNADGAGSAQDRATHDERARLYAERIVAWRREAGLPEAGWPGADAGATEQ